MQSDKESFAVAIIGVDEIFLPMHLFNKYINAFIVMDRISIMTVALVTIIFFGLIIFSIYDFPVSNPINIIATETSIALIYSNLP